MADTWAEILVGSFREVVQRLAALTPRFLAALTLVLAGLIVAALARSIVVKVFRAMDLDGRCVQLGVMTALGRAGIRRSPSEMLGRLVFWLLFVIALLMGVEAMEVPATAGLVGVAMRILPNLVVAALVLVIGWLVAHLAAQTVLIFVVNAQVPGGPVIAGIVRWLVLIFAGGVALTQLDIAREMVLLVFGIALGGAVLSLALAFGLGARDLAREALEGWLRRRRREEPDHLTHV
jgi:hypothetical protein